MKVRIVFLSLTIIFTGVLFSSGVKKKEVKSLESFISGKLKGTAVSKKDKLIPGIKTENISVPEEEYILSADISSGGIIYVGTGHNGKLYKIGKNGKTENIFTAKEPDIYSVLVTDDNSVYFGTSPRGRVYRMDPKGDVKEFFNPDEKYIWDLKKDKSGRIICAVGGSGAVYSIDPGGNSKKVFSANDTHILSLYITSGNRIVAGSAPKGILYGVKNGKVSVLDDTPRSEVRAICGDDKGNIFYASSDSGEKKPYSFATEAEQSISPVKKRFKMSKSEGHIYQLNPDGNVELLWISDQHKFGSIYSIIYDKINGAILAGSSKGKLFRIRNLNDYTLVYEGESETLYKMIGMKSDFLMIFNNTPKIIKGTYAGKERGVYVSKVFNLGYYSNMGKIYWTPGNGNYTGITLAVRAGNTETPDKSWTDWSAPIEGSSGKNIGIKGFGFSQVRISLRTSEANKNPSVRSFKFYYIQSNLKPVIMNAVVDMVNREKKKKPDGLEKKKSGRTGKVKISWLAIDPNRDKLEFSLFMKKESDGEWFNIAENIAEKSFEFDKKLYEDGLYRVKIVADDSMSNSPESSLKEVLISDIFTLDSTPPVISNYKMSGNVISFNVTDNISVIGSVSYSVDGKRWKPLFPVDSIADSQVELYRLDRREVKKAKGVLFFKVTDENMNFRIYQKNI